ncbi:hypothetical protein [Nesterenkonia ebinurensis]|uniref:hypothetical protein n=1 Tax=Nesterenkonia ebinurensis TaxID=2608252 RepID=UPI00123CACDF|nr:hypothetical protein [Nesterenkonia ebinurensis]
MTITAPETSRQFATLAGPEVPRQNELFTAATLEFLGVLHQEFGPRVEALGSDGTRRSSTRDWALLVDQHLSEPPSSFISPQRLARAQDKVICNGTGISAGLVDFGLHIFRNAQRLLNDGRAPFVSLPGTESEEELQVWQELFIRAEQLLELPEGTIRAIHLRPGEPDQDDDEDGTPCSAEVLISRASN